MENRETEKDMLRSIGKQSGESVESVWKKKRNAVLNTQCNQTGHLN